MKKFIVFAFLLIQLVVKAQVVGTPYMPNQRAAIFVYTGSIQTWTVPTGVSSIKAYVLGAQGGTFNTTAGGKGGLVTCNISVTAGSVLQITVGGQSSNDAAVYGFGGNGGKSTTYGTIARAGGGLSAISTAAPVSQTNAIVIAGGGGGATGGSSPGFGGAGGGTSGIDGGTAYGGTLTYGKGATQLAGGAAGAIVDANNPLPQAGTAISGGAGGIVGGFSSGWNGGGGGGAGYFGGGGGAGGGNAQAGGGGGSSWTSSSCTNVSNQANINVGNGRVVIYY